MEICNAPQELESELREKIAKRTIQNDAAETTAAQPGFEGGDCARGVDRQDQRARGSAEYKIKDSVIYSWRNEVIAKLPLVFNPKTVDTDDQEKIAELERLIGQQAVEIEALKKAGRWLNRLSRSSDGS